MCRDSESLNPEVLIHLLPGGRMPKRQTEGAIGHDVSLRAILSSTEMNPENPNLRKTLFDFKTIPEDPEIAKHVIEVSSEDGKKTELAYKLEPGESVLGGIGFISAMPFPLFFWIAPRSGLASKYGITVTNAPGTVDPDYRGEAGVLVLNRSDKIFKLFHNMRVAQVVFQWAIIPELILVASLNELPNTLRGPGGFGSTGLE